MEKQSDLVRCLLCDLVFPIFVAGNMLLRGWRQSGRQDIGIQRNLELCVRWLNALGQNWKSAKARRQVLAECKNITSSFGSRTDAIASHGHHDSPQRTAPVIIKLAIHKSWNRGLDLGRRFWPGLHAMDIWRRFPELFRMNPAFHITDCEPPSKAKACHSHKGIFTWAGRTVYSWLRHRGEEEGKRREKACRERYRMLRVSNEKEGGQ